MGRNNGMRVSDPPPQSMRSDSKEVVIRGGGGAGERHTKRADGERPKIFRSVIRGA